MLLDAEQLEERWFKVFDVCICGAGPAGITLARQLASKGRQVGLFEAGGLDLSHESQELYEGEIVGLPYFPLDSARVRCLGGASNHWEGYSRALDARDFEPSSYNPGNEWPLRKSDLANYASDTNSILELPREGLATYVLDGDERALTEYAYRKRPTRFGERYRLELEKSDLITVCLNANLLDIELDAGLGSVSFATFRSYGRRASFSARARYFVLCLGGIENARLLLNATRQMTPGIGNQHDLVGRFFSEHPNVVVGDAIMSTQPTRRFYIAPTRLLSECKCLSFQMDVVPKERRPGTGGYVDAAVCSTSLTQRVAEALLGRAPVCFDAQVEVTSAQAPNWHSRVMLSDKRDRFGMRQVALDWQLTELDQHTLKVAALEIGRVMAEQNVGRMQLAPWLRDSVPNIAAGALDGSFHHMCTTRMSDDPKLGVVDRNCRVHGIENLFIGGSSVFSSSGLSNPTYTIIQLALRLGDHLHTRLGS